MIPDPNFVGLTRSSEAFAPELVICMGILLMLFLRLFSNRSHMGLIALLVTGTALFTTWLQWDQTYLPWLESPREYMLLNPRSDIFSGMLVYDNFTIFLRFFLYGFMLLVIWLTMLTGIPDAEDSADFYTLLLGATLGMALMSATNHLLMMFIAIEMASLPSYGLAGFLKGRRQSSEASLKYVVYGGGAAGVMLYGISLLAGRAGTANMPLLAEYCAREFTQAGTSGVDPILVLGVLFILIGIAFKLSAVPFHFWCPDVFEGASAEVAGFLSVASKGAALALLARVALVLAGLDPNVTTLNTVPWEKVTTWLVPTLAVAGIVTATFGNLAAYLQTNLKRLLAYSTIAHAGYMIMGLATVNREGVQAVLFYLIAYMLMNLGAFAVIAFIRNQMGSEDLESYRGLVRRAPILVVMLSIFLLSLLGIPPLAGFAAKFQIFAALYDSAQHSNDKVVSTTLYITLAAGLLNSVLSAFYYMKVLKVMTIDSRLEDIEGSEPAPLRQTPGSVIYASVFALAVFVVGIMWGPLDQWSARGTERFRPELKKTAPPAAGTATANQRSPAE